MGRQVCLDMVRRQNAVAIDKQQVVCGRGSHARVSAASGLKSLVIVGHEPHWQGRGPGKVRHDLRRFIARAIVGHDDFQPPAGLLARDRLERPPQMPWHLIGRHDHGEIGTVHRAASLLRTGRGAGKGLAQRPAAES
jgi:hypothetical protein